MRVTIKYKNWLRRIDSGKRIEEEEEKKEKKRRKKGSVATYLAFLLVEELACWRVSGYRLSRFRPMNVDIYDGGRPCRAMLSCRRL